MMVGVVLMFLISCLALNTHGFTVKTTEDESFLAQPHYLNNDQLQYFCENLSKQNPDLVQVQSIGRSLRGRDLLVLRIGKDVSRNSRRPLLGENEISFI